MHWPLTSLRQNLHQYQQPQKYIKYKKIVINVVFVAVFMIVFVVFFVDVFGMVYVVLFVFVGIIIISPSQEKE